MTTLPRFRLQVAAPTLGTAGPTASDAPTMMCLDLRGIGDSTPEPGETPANSHKQGSFNYDREKGGYVHEWDSFAEFDVWRWQEELAHSIELVVCRTGAGGWLFVRKKTYCCLRQQTGGQSQYKKKHPDWNRKLESKKTGCRCQITIKLYPHTLTVLGRYDADHDHEVGLANIAYTRMSPAARETINVMLKQKMDHKEIVCKRSESLNNRSDTFTDMQNTDLGAFREPGSLYLPA